MASRPGILPEDMRALERYGFKPETAYMEVPRCDGCKWWRGHGAGFLTGDCDVRSSDRPGIWVRDESEDHGSHFHAICTDADFGCVQWEPTE